MDTAVNFPVSSARRTAYRIFSVIFALSAIAAALSCRFFASALTGISVIPKFSAAGGAGIVPAIICDAAPTLLSLAVILLVSDSAILPVVGAALSVSQALVIGAAFPLALSGVHQAIQVICAASLPAILAAFTAALAARSDKSGIMWRILLLFFFAGLAVLLKSALALALRVT